MEKFDSRYKFNSVSFEFGHGEVIDNLQSRPSFDIKNSYTGTIKTVWSGNIDPVETFRNILKINRHGEIKEHLASFYKSEKISVGEFLESIAFINLRTGEDKFIYKLFSDTFSDDEIYTGYIIVEYEDKGTEDRDVSVTDWAVHRLFLCQIDLTVEDIEEAKALRLAF